MKVLKSTAREYASHMRIAQHTYSIGLAKAQSLQLADAQERAARGICELLPKGRKTPHHYFYALHQGNSRIGYLWLQKQDDIYLFICDIYLFTRFRSKGFGSKTMAWIEQKARKLNCSEVRLHVYGHNFRAIYFYDRYGFESNHIFMRKKVAGRTKSR